MSRAFHKFVWAVFTIGFLYAVVHTAIVLLTGHAGG
jgi:hypothetical protein